MNFVYMCLFIKLFSCVIGVIWLKYLLEGILAVCEMTHFHLLCLITKYFAPKTRGLSGDVSLECWKLCKKKCWTN